MTSTIISQSENELIVRAGRSQYVALRGDTDRWSIWRRADTYPGAPPAADKVRKADVRAVCVRLERQRIQK